MFVYIYLLPQKLPIEKSSETPNETNSPQDSSCGNTVLTHSMTEPKQQLQRPGVVGPG